MPNMIERVTADVENMRIDCYGTDKQTARAAVEAMREPTEAMLVAARDWSAAKYGKPIGNDAATGCWHAMIDAALKE